MKVHRLGITESGPYTHEVRDFGDVNDANAAVITAWARKDTLAVVLQTPKGSEDARYERPGVDPGRLPEAWPRRVPRLGEESALAEAGRVQWADPPAGLTVTVAEEPRPATGPSRPVKRVRGGGLVEVVPEEPPGAPCRCCAQGPAVAVAEDRDQSPSGRLNRHCCPHCGRRWPASDASLLDIQRRYLGTLGGGVTVVDAGRPR